MSLTVVLDGVVVVLGKGISLGNLKWQWIDAGSGAQYPWLRFVSGE